MRLRRVRAILGFHVGLVELLPGIIGKRVAGMANVIGVIAAVLLWFNQPIGERFVSGWPGLPQWVALVPLGLVVGYDLLAANYDRYEELRRARDRAEVERANAQATLARRTDTAAGLAEFSQRIAEGNALTQRGRKWQRWTGGTRGAYLEWQAAEAQRRAEFEHDIREWREACRTTVIAYLPYREHVLAQPQLTREPRLHVIPWVNLFLHEFVALLNLFILTLCVRVVPTVWHDREPNRKRA